MYRITYIHKGSEIENPLYTAGDQDYCLTDARLDLEMGMAGELNIYVPETNPARYDVECLTDEVIVYRNEEEIFRGRPITVQMDFVKTGQLTCEGILAYLYDTYFEPFEFEGSPKELLTLIINNHNSHVEERKRFTVGDITVIDNNDYINRSSIYYDRSLNVMTEKLIKDSLGGYFRVRVDGGVRYLDYLENYDTQATQMVQYGENILDIATDVEYSDLATVILPLGARLEDEDGVQTDEYTTIASVNGGSIYYEDPAAVEEYGWICVCAEWEDVTIPDNLLTKAKQYLEQVTNAVQSFRINAVDLSLVSDEYEAIKVGDYVYVRSVAHGINQYIELTAMTLYPLAPENDVLQFGGDTATLTDAQRNNDRSVQTALGSLSMRVTNLTATVINAVYANIEEIVASTITTDYIRAAVADMGYVTVDYLIDNYASIQYLEANYASIIELEAALANVELLNADVANILNVLAGNVGTGDLQTIVLTADNAIIDDAIIINALMGTVLADIITSNVIYTDYIKIANNEDQSLWIDGSTLQFTDENSVVRVQIGLDASGNYNYYLWDAEGNLIWDPMGLTEAGLTGNGAIIKDAAVADDANISAYKLNIEELTSVLNENGDLILSAEQVTIGGGTLDYALTEITQQIENLEALDAVEYVENWYILGGPDAPPCEPGEDGAASILGEMILGEAVLGTSYWTTEQPKVYEGEYVWFSQKIVYTNGDVLWTTPTLLTDEYVRSVVSIQQTELEVVQGQIQAKIWQTDITEATTLLGEEIDTISEQYGILTILVDTIDERVGALTTTVTDNYEELSSQVTAITATLDGINAEVREVYQKNPLTEGVPYYAVSYSPDSYPPFEWEDDQTAVLGEAILGLMVLGVNGDSNWTTDQPEYAEGQYIWIAYLRTRLDGSTYWTTPTLLTDEYLRENVTEMSEKYAEITMTVEGIREEVVNVQATLNNDYSTTTEIKAVIDAAVSESESTIMQEVAYNYVDQGTLADTLGNYYTGTTVDALISASASATSGEILQQVSYTYATIDYVGDVLSGLELDAVKSIETYYGVADNPDEPKNLGWHLFEDFSGGELPDGWTESSHGEFDYSGDDTLGPCVKITKNNSSTTYDTYVSYNLPYTGTVRVACDMASTDGRCCVSCGSSIWSVTSGLSRDGWRGFQRDFSLSQVGSVQLQAHPSSDIGASVFFANVKITYPDEESDIDWGTDYPTVSDGEYLWVRYLITYSDGHTEWTEAFCVTDDMSDYVTLAKLTENTATIEQYVDESSASIRSEVQSFYSELSGEISSTAATIEQYVDSSMASISLTVTDGALGSTAKITLSSNGGESVQSIDLTKVREAFANDKSAITISAGTVAFISNTLLITSSQFTLDSSGNATFSGNLSAPSGTIGGWTIESSKLSADTSTSSTKAASEISTSAIDQRYSYWETKIASGGITTYTYTTATGSTVAGSININGYSIDIQSDTYTNHLNHHSMELAISNSVWFFAESSNKQVAITNSGSLVVNGSSITGSDELLKKNMTLVDDPQAFTGERDYEKVVDSLEPVSFQYKQETGEKKHIGFTYQNAVEALEAGGIDPDESAMVQMIEDPDTGESYGGIEYNDIVALLVYEVKKLKSEINEMKGA